MCSKGAEEALLVLSRDLHGTFSSAVASVCHELCLSWRECLLCTDGSFIFYHEPSACQEELSTERWGC